MTVTAVNDAPTCADVSLTTAEDTTGSTAPDCADVDGDALTYSIVGQPADGSAAVVLGQLEYSPDLNFNGTDSFTYQANDGPLDSNVATVDVTVTAVNDAPTCADVSLTTAEDTTGSTAPDCADVDGDALTYSIVSQPTDGSAAVVLGQLEYSPDLNFNGTDSFTYRANDGDLDQQRRHGRRDRHRGQRRAGLRRTSRYDGRGHDRTRPRPTAATSTATR